MDSEVDNLKILDRYSIVCKDKVMQNLCSENTERIGDSEVDYQTSSSFVVQPIKESCQVLNGDMDCDTDTIEDNFCLENYCLENVEQSSEIYDVNSFVVGNDDNPEDQELNAALAYQDLNLIYSEERIHICDVCARTFRKKSNLKRHYRSHTGDNPHTCNQCGARYPTMSRLKEHMHAHSGLRPYACELCNKTFARTSNLTRHYRTHNGEKSFQCDQCDSSFIEATRLREHYLTHTGEKKYACDVCDKRFLKKYNLKRHYRTHTGENPHHCAQCGRFFSKRIYLLVHMATHSKEKDDKSEPEVKVKGKRLKRKKKRTPDTGLRERERPNEIPHDILIGDSEESRDAPKDNVDVDAIPESSFQTHTFDNFEEKLYSCNQCSRHFIKKKSLAVHIQKHIGKDPLKCNVCNASFTHVSRLKEHFVTHSGEKAFPCVVCGKRFGRNSNLLRHLTTHTGEKRHECDICNKRYSNASRLREHLLCHTGAKPHQCDICKRHFRHKFGLQRHKLTHTGEKQYKCEYCPKKFSRRSRLSAHYSTHGKQLPANFPANHLDQLFVIHNKVEPRLNKIIENLEARLTEPSQDSGVLSSQEETARSDSGEPLPLMMDEQTELVVETLIAMANSNGHINVELNVNPTEGSPDITTGTISSETVLDGIQTVSVEVFELENSIAKKSELHHQTDSTITIKSEPAECCE